MGLSQSDRLMAIADNECVAFHDAYTAFVDVQSRGHRETWPVRSREFTLWLQHRYFHAHRGAPNRAALRAALDMVEAQGRFEGAHKRVFRRVASLGNRLYLDLANSAWNAVEIAATGWRIVDQPPVRFTRSPTTRALATPEPGGRLSDLRPHLNLASDDDFVLLTSWILAALRDTGPYPVLVLLGEQGSAKSTTMRIVRSVTDPLEAPVRTLPRSERDLYIEAANSHLLAYDNVSAVPLWLSDALCRLSTGGGISTRRLYTDASELVIGGSRPTILNGIDEFVTRGDLADRTIFLHVPVIPETRYATEAAVWARFERERSRILGALLDAVSTGIDSHADVRREGLPRMSDFAAWAIACESAKSRGAFLRAYERNRAEAVASVIDTSPVASAVRIWMEESLTSWTGEAAALYAELTRTADRAGLIERGWPANGQALSRQLNRLSPVLRRAGISIVRERGARRLIRITGRRHDDGRIASNASRCDANDAFDAISRPATVGAGQPIGPRPRGASTS